MQTPDSLCGEASLLTPIGGDCGYCKGEDSSASYYARTKSLCPPHYQELMDRGWRRSGVLLYIPDASRSCCPHYTIRLPANQFRSTRDQRQALHRWNRFVLGESYIKEVARKYPKTKEEKKRANTSFDLITTVHEGELVNVKPDIEPAHKLEVTLEPDTFTEEKFRLFDNYQRHVHHEKDSDITRGGFRRFLCSSPLHRHDDGSKKIGSFHQMYRLDGRLIAMSVLDLLPHAVSGVYFIYHSDFEKWSFGKLSALRETALAIEGGYDLYYMGYFIWNCKKMRYKGDYKPQTVLDYDTLEWDVMDAEMRSLMDKRKWVGMSRERQIKQALDLHGFSTTSPDSDFESTLAESAYSTLHPSPLLATTSGLSLLSLKMPGALSLETVLAEFSLDEMKVTLGRSAIHEMQDIVSWTQGDVTDNSSIRGIMAELAACIGPKLASEIVVDLGR